MSQTDPTMGAQSPRGRRLPSGILQGELNSMRNRSGFRERVVAKTVRDAVYGDRMNIPLAVLIWTQLANTVAEAAGVPFSKHATRCSTKP